jgi:hypothetical protein
MTSTYTRTAINSQANLKYFIPRQPLDRLHLRLTTLNTTLVVSFIVGGPPLQQSMTITGGPKSNSAPKSSQKWARTGKSDQHV